jgi:23S rRNA (cytidine2498-2'-O)-methyltransferase
MTGSSTAYLAPEGLVPQTVHWLRNITATHERLIVAAGDTQFAPFAQNIWRAPQLITFTSITDAAAKLKQIQRNWYPYSFQLHRRTALIQEKLPFVKFRPLDFPSVLPEAPLGSFTLLDEHTLLASADCSSRYPNGEPQFIENHIDPPSRAYMKLFEGLTVLANTPRRGERCMELGASPGGWTWVIAGTGADVVAIDRAPLDERIARMPNVSFRAGDAFTMTPDKIGALDWLFSDVICYPEKLFDFARKWLDSGKCRHYLLTLKFQGETNYDIIEKFAAVPGSRLLHLHANKHELTWYHGPDAAAGGT